MELSYDTVSSILERWTDEGIVHDRAADYGEPGYSHGGGETPIVVLGNYWCRCGAPDELHDHATHHPRLWDQLEGQGVSFEWHDEWVVDHDADKAYRTSPDSYMWQPSTVCDDNGELLTPDDDIEAWVDWANGEPSRCLPSVVWDAGDLMGAGFAQHNGKYEAGWHPGQDDDPRKVLATIRREHGDDVDVVFLLDSTGQFDATFSAWVREEAER